LIYVAYAAVLGASLSGFTIDPSKMSPPSRVYYDCMMKHTALYAKKSPSADEVIAAAGAACRSARERSILEAASATLKEMRSKGLDPDPAVVLSGTREGVDDADAIMRPDLIRNVLDSR